MTYNDAMEFPVALAYQLQHAHCRSLDMTCYFAGGKEDMVDDLMNQFQVCSNITDELDELV